MSSKNGDWGVECLASFTIYGHYDACIAVELIYGKVSTRLMKEIRDLWSRPRSRARRGIGVPASGGSRGPCPLFAGSGSRMDASQWMLLIFMYVKSFLEGSWPG